MDNIDSFFKGLLNLTPDVASSPQLKKDNPTPTKPKDTEESKDISTKGKSADKQKIQSSLSNSEVSQP